MSNPAFFSIRPKDIDLDCIVAAPSVTAENSEELPIIEDDQVEKTVVHKEELKQTISVSNETVSQLPKQQPSAIEKDYQSQPNNPKQPKSVVANAQPKVTEPLVKNEDMEIQPENIQKPTQDEDVKSTSLKDRFDERQQSFTEKLQKDKGSISSSA